MTVFLSYSRDDADAIEQLRKDIEALRGPVWFDRKLRGGQDWWNEILEEIRDCDLFVLAVSDRSLRSIACLAEMRYALRLTEGIPPGGGGRRRSASRSRRGLPNPTRRFRTTHDWQRARAGPGGRRCRGARATCRIRSLIHPPCPSRTATRFGEGWPLRLSTRTTRWSWWPC